jgi:hypothetical protein
MEQDNEILQQAGGLMTWLMLLLLPLAILAQLAKRNK